VKAAAARFLREGRQSIGRLPWRTLAAVIIAPPLGGASVGAIIAVAVFALALAGGGTIPMLLFYGLAIGVFYGLAIGAVVGIPLMATLGLLVHAWLRSTGRTQCEIYMFAGQIGGILAGIAVMCIWGGVALWFMLPSFLGGGFAGGFFCLIARPDREVGRRRR
jgi:hypothetical protein